MDQIKGRESSAHRPDAGQQPENYSGQDRRSDLVKEAYSGAAMHRLESDMGLPGYLCGSHKVQREERAKPAPFYPQEEPRGNPHAGIIPVMPREQQQSQIIQRNQQQRYEQDAAIGDRRYAIQPPQRYNNSGQENYSPTRQYRAPHMVPGGCEDVCHPERYAPQGLSYDQQQAYDQQQFQAMQQQARQQRYALQQGMINGENFFNNGNQRFQPSRNPELDRYRQQWWQQAQNADGQRYYPNQNQDDRYRQQWSQDSQYPSDARFTPGRNQELNNFRNQWWRNANTRPPSFDRPGPSQFPQNQQYPEDLEPGYPYPSDRNQQYPSDRNQPYPSQQYPDARNQQYSTDRNQQFNEQSQFDNRMDPRQAENLNRALNSVLGHSIQDFDRSVPVRLGCVRAVSLVLEREFGIPIKEQNTDGLESFLTNNGWKPVSPSQIQPNDVIVGHRKAGVPGHAAIYLGNDQIFNNDSNAGVMQIDSAAKFRTGEFVEINVYRKVR